MPKCVIVNNFTARVSQSVRLSTNIKNTDMVHLQTRAARRDLARARPCRSPLSDWPGKSIYTFWELVKLGKLFAQEEMCYPCSQVELALAYNCAESLTKKNLIDYVHRNRLVNSMRITTLGNSKAQIQKHINNRYCFFIANISNLHPFLTLLYPFPEGDIEN